MPVWFLVKILKFHKVCFEAILHMLTHARSLTVIAILLVRYPSAMDGLSRNQTMTLGYVTQLLLVSCMRIFSIVQI